MFISVDLPAPFSPSSAWTSPSRRSKLDVVVRDDAREALRDVAHLEDGGPRRASAQDSYVPRPRPCRGRARAASTVERRQSRTSTAVLRSDAARRERIGARGDPFLDVDTGPPKRDGRALGPPIRLRAGRQPATVRGGLTLPAAICFDHLPLSVATSAARFGAFVADLAEADAAVLHVEDAVDAALELAVLGELDRL